MNSLSLPTAFSLYLPWCTTVSFTNVDQSLVKLARKRIKKTNFVSRADDKNGQRGSNYAIIKNYSIIF